MSNGNPNLPKPILTLRSYSKQIFIHDLLAGIAVRFDAIPQGLPHIVIPPFQLEVIMPLIFLRSRLPFWLHLKSCSRPWLPTA